MFRFLHQDQWFTASILVVGTLLLVFSSAMLRFDYVFYDIGQYFSPKTPPEDIVIIAIDEPSLAQLGKWPWTRETHAQLITQLQQSNTKAIGFDVLIAEPDMQHPMDDMALAKAIKEAGNVVLPVVIEAPYPGAPLKQNNPIALLVDQAASIGRVNVPLDGDGIARGFYRWQGLGDQPVSSLTPHFAQSVLQVAKMLPNSQKQIPVAGTDWQSQYHKIHFYGESSSFQQVSYVDVWAGRVAKNFFDNKIVLVGATAIGMGDLIATPMSSFSSPMSGVEFNANVVAALRDGALTSDMPLWLSLLIAMVLVVLPVLWLPNQPPFQSFMMILAYVIVILACSMALPYLFNLWFKPSAVLLMVLLAYPIWSWRRLERAYAHLDVELQYLKADLLEFGLQADQVDAINKTPRLRDDLLQSRISQVRYASQLLRDLQHKKNESLAFISHDLRMPLATAMMMLNESDFVKKKSRIAAMLEQANQLAEDFLSISKAETFKVGDFKEVELRGLLQEAVDHIYQLAKEKQITVDLQLPEQAVWVSGNFSLLHRACVNVLNNAIKFSKQGGMVEVGMQNENAEAVIWVKDYGSGIPAEKLTQVFEKFKRLEGQPVMQGAGLGLYFVDITLKKHAGSVTVESEEGHWSQFKFTIPSLT